MSWNLDPVACVQIDHHNTVCVVESYDIVNTGARYRATFVDGHVGMGFGNTIDGAIQALADNLIQLAVRVKVAQVKS